MQNSDQSPEWETNEQWTSSVPDSCVTLGRSCPSCWRLVGRGECGWGQAGRGGTGSGGQLSQPLLVRGPRSHPAAPWLLSSRSRSHQTAALPWESEMGKIRVCQPCPTLPPDSPPPCSIDTGSPPSDPKTTRFVGGPLVCPPGRGLGRGLQVRRGP